MTAPLLAVEGLTARVHLSAGDAAEVLSDVSFSVAAGETVAIVGESGCGKSMTALALMGLLPEPAVRLTSGAIRLEGRDIAHLPEGERRKLRGRRIAMIFQDPIGALNPVVSVGRQIVEALVHQGGLTSSAARRRALDLLAAVNIPDPEARFDEFPHRLSGGMCQRIGIALAIANDPRLLIADEPTTALDVTIQAQVLRLLKELQIRTGAAMIFITHDLGVVAEVADRVVVMYAGRVVEEGPVADLFDLPLHPYTRGLLGSTLRPGRSSRRLAEIPGRVPTLGSAGPGCAFANRCERVRDECRGRTPALTWPRPGRAVACFVVEEDLRNDVASFAL